MIEFTKDKIKVIFKIKDVTIDELQLKKYNIEKKNSLFSLEVSDEEEVISKWDYICDISDHTEKTMEILVLQDFTITFGDQDIAEELTNKLFKPNFKCVEYSFSKINFYIRKKYLYNVEIDYDFEQAINVEIGRFIYKDTEINNTFNEINQIANDIFEQLKEAL